MALRQLAIVGLLGGAGYLAWRMYQDGTNNVYSPLAIDFSSYNIIPDVGSDIGNYLASLSAAEDPSGNPYAKNPYSTASGLYQFTRGTWTALGGQWGNDPSKAFGGLFPSVAEQTAMAQKLTTSNANILSQLGTEINNLTLYAAHIFGPSKAATVLNSDPSTDLASLMPSSTVKANPALGTSVASFLSYLQKKVG